VSRFCSILTILMFTLACWAHNPLVRIESRTEGSQKSQMTEQKTTKPAPARPTSDPNERGAPAVPKLIKATPEQTQVPERTSSIKETVSPKRTSTSMAEAERDGSAKVETGKQDDTKPQRAEQIERLKNLIELVKKHKAAENEVTEAEKKMAIAEEELMVGITGLIIEETMTKIGYDFYEYFYLLWEAPGEIPVKDYNIFISERASPLWGSWVQVRVDERIVWNSVLRPRSTEIEDAAKEAIEATKEYLVNYEQYQFKTNDMVGTGI
jgi:curli production assembly/transport component CsgE